MVVVYAAMVALILGSANSDGGGAGLIGMFLMYAVIMVVVFYIQAAPISGVLKIADGVNVTVADAFVPRNIGPVILTALRLVMVASLIGSIVIIGSLVVAFFCQFAIISAIDKNLAPVDAIKARSSWSRTTSATLSSPS